MQNFGFTSFSTPQPTVPSTPGITNPNYNPALFNINEQEPKEGQVETPEMLEIKKQITAIVSRYPNIQLRSTFKLLEKLNNLSQEELNNMLTNAQNDIAQLNGTPGADFILSFIGSLGDQYVPGFMEECMNDVILQRDIENQIFNYVGIMGPTATIPLRVAGCASRAKKRARENQKFAIFDPRVNYATQTNNNSPPSNKKQKENSDNPVVEQNQNSDNQQFAGGQFSTKSTSLRDRYSPNMPLVFSNTDTHCPEPNTN